jgi:hypothetical protein
MVLSSFGFLCPYLSYTLYLSLHLGYMYLAASSLHFNHPEEGDCDIRRNISHFVSE